MYTHTNSAVGNLAAKLEKKDVRHVAPDCAPQVQQGPPTSAPPTTDPKPKPDTAGGPDRRRKTDLQSVAGFGNFRGYRAEETSTNAHIIDISDLKTLKGNHQ